MNDRSEILAYLHNLSLFIISALLVTFPLLFLVSFTDAFTLPKLILFGIASFLLVVVLGIRMIVHGTIRIRRTPFDLPIFLFTLIAGISAFLSINRVDAITAFIPIFFSAVLFYSLVNLVRNEESFSVVSTAWVIGAMVVSLLAILNYTKVYPLPFTFAKNQAFNTFGSMLDQALFLLFSLPIALYAALPHEGKTFISKMSKARGKEIGFLVASAIILGGFLVSTYQLVRTQQPILLPFEAGFQTAFAEISQDNGRVLQSFLFGSGPGTYGTDFTRFKPPSLNLNQTLWSFTFIRSSSLLLEVLATTGVLGLLAFIYLIIKVLKENDRLRLLRENYLFLSILFVLGASLVLPFSPTLFIILFLVLALFAVSQSVKHSPTQAHRFFDIELQVLALKKGLISLATSPTTSLENMFHPKPRGDERSFSRFVPASLFGLLILGFIIIAYFAIPYVISDMTLKQALDYAAKNDGAKTYDLQTKAITTFPWRDGNYRIFSQTNFALASSLASQIKGASPSASQQQQILGFIQQSINAARNATTVGPLTSANWDNLSSIYRNLIGYGQNAESFAVLAARQAAVLDPNNPQEYLNLGGIYYQLGQWDEAIRQFQIAVTLKPDFSNAYYNLGHAYEQKGDLQNALRSYQTVQGLVAQNKDSLKKITDEIQALNDKIKNATPQEKPAPKSITQTEEPLQLSSPSAKLPVQKQPIQLPPPPQPKVDQAGPTPTILPTASPLPTRQ